MERNERNTPKTDLKALLEQYLKDVRAVESRIDTLKELLRLHPLPDEMTDLEKRIRLLNNERRELLYVCEQLDRLCAPKPPHPSLRYRECVSS